MLGRLERLGVSGCGDQKARSTSHRAFCESLPVGESAERNLDKTERVGEQGEGLRLLASLPTLGSLAAEASAGFATWASTKLRGSGGTCLGSADVDLLRCPAEPADGLTSPSPASAVSAVSSLWKAGGPPVPASARRQSREAGDAGTEPPPVAEAKGTSALPGVPEQGDQLPDPLAAKDGTPGSCTASWASRLTFANSACPDISRACFHEHR